MLTKSVWTKTIVRPLHDRGMTLVALAKLHGIHPSAMRALRMRTCRKAEAVVAQFLGETVEKLFPDRYPIQKSRILSSKYADLLASQKSHASAGMEKAA